MAPSGPRDEPSARAAPNVKAPAPELGFGNGKMRARPAYVEQRSDTRPVAEAAMGLAPYLLSRLLSAGSLARAAPPNSCAHSDSMAARSQLVAFERGPQCRMNRESLAAIQPLPSPMPTFRSVWLKDTPTHTQVSSFGFRRYHRAGWADFRRIIPAPQAKRMASQMGINSRNSRATAGSASRSGGK